MKILIVNGQPRSGKDLFCEYASNNCSLVYPISTIDRVKQVAIFAGWSGEKDAKGRKFLSDLKDAMTAYKDIPYNYVINFIDNRVRVLDNLDMFGSENAVFLVQSREPQDIKRWVQRNGAKTVFIRRKDVDKKWGNHADDEVANYDYDYYLDNDGSLEDWEAKTVAFINQMREEEWESYI